jgi:hypothetical protein
MVSAKFFDTILYLGFGQMILFDNCLMVSARFFDTILYLGFGQNGCDGILSKE